MVNVTRSERETIITRAADESDWHVFTEDPRVIRRMEKNHGPGKKVGALGFEWTVPSACVSLRKPMSINAAARKARVKALEAARAARARNAVDEQG